MSAFDDLVAESGLDPNDPTLLALKGVLDETASETWVFDPPHKVARQNEVCPVWGDTLGMKDVTVVVDPDREADAIASLSYVHGGDSVTRRKVLDDGRIAFRSEYQCW